jgi:hypothetical protein
MIRILLKLCKPDTNKQALLLIIHLLNPYRLEDAQCYNSFSLSQFVADRDFERSARLKTSYCIMHLQRRYVTRNIEQNLLTYNTQHESIALGVRIYCKTFFVSKNIN